MDADVIEVPVQAVVVECDHGICAIVPNRRHDFRVQQRRVSPPQVAIGMIEDHRVGKAQHLDSLAQFLRADASEIAVWNQRGIADRAFSAE